MDRRRDTGCVAVVEADTGKTIVMRKVGQRMFTRMDKYCGLPGGGVPVPDGAEPDRRTLY